MLARELNSTGLRVNAHQYSSAHQLAVQSPHALGTSRAHRRLQPTRAAPSLSDSSQDELTLEDNSDKGARPSGRALRERHVFTFRRWHVHRNTNERYMRHMKGMLSSVTWRNLTPPLTAITGIAVINGFYQTLYDGGLLPEDAPLLQLSDGPLELTSFALSLLLVFRTDSSYSRWTEALDVWSKVRNTSKDLVRDAVCWIRDPSLLSVIVRWTLTYATSLKVYLRENGNIDTATARLLLKHEHHVFVNLCKDTSSAYPQYALHVLTQAVVRANLPPHREDKLLTGLTTLNTCIGACEKLLRYPIPLSYTRHTSRFMIIWLAVLPLALWDDCGWWSVPITTIISFLLLGIEEIGVAIEEPFALLPLKDIVRDIEKDLWAITASRKEVSSLLDLSLSLSAGDTLAQLLSSVQQQSSTNKNSNGTPALAAVPASATPSQRAVAVMEASLAMSSRSLSSEDDEGEESAESSPDQSYVSWASATGAPALLGGDRSPSPPEQREQLLDIVDSVLATAESSAAPVEAESVLFDSMEEVPSPPRVGVAAGSKRS